MDLSTATVGERSTVPISVTVDIEAVRIQDYAPQSQVVQLEAVESITVPIDVRIQGDVATGYQATLPIVRPEFATIEGPVPYLSEVFSVTGTINVDGVRSDISRKVTITPRDEDGTVVGGVIWEPEQADVSIGVRRKAGFKPDVLVVPDLRGDPASGYRRASVSVEPSTVTLAGPRSVLDDLPGFVRTLPISVTGITEDLVRSTAITVPAGVVVAEGSYVTVTVEILPVLSSRTFTSSVEIQGLRQGWVATLSPDSVEIIIAGPDARLSELVAADVQVFVNLFDFPLGIHRVEPVPLVPEGLEIVSIIPETIEVEIELPPTPTAPAGLGGEGE
jgi:YbbR domain-containing protein